MDNTKNIFTTYYYSDQHINIFYSLYRECSKTFGCFYMGYILEDWFTKTRVGFTTNPDWQREYIENSLLDVCHLWKAGQDFYENTDHQHLILPWMYVQPQTSQQKDIILFREEMGIGQNGISFCTKNSRWREYLFFAPDKNGKNFLKFININIPLVRKCCRKFRDISKFQLSNINNLII